MHAFQFILQRTTKHYKLRWSGEDNNFWTIWKREGGMSLKLFFRRIRRDKTNFSSCGWRSIGFKSGVGEDVSIHQTTGVRCLWFFKHFCVLLQDDGESVQTFSITVVSFIVAWSRRHFTNTSISQEIAQQTVAKPFSSCCHEENLLQPLSRHSQIFIHARWSRCFKMLLMLRSKKH